MDPYLLGLLLQAAPGLGVCLVGLIVAVEFRARHPRASLLASLGLLVIVGSRVGGIVLQMWIRNKALSGLRASDLGTPLTIYNFGLSGLSAIGLALIIVAVFSDRTRRQTNI
jgi:hypothetical protein